MPQKSSASVLTVFVSAVVCQVLYKRKNYTLNNLIRTVPWSKLDNFFVEKYCRENISLQIFDWKEKKNYLSSHKEFLCRLSICSFVCLCSGYLWKETTVISIVLPFVYHRFSHFTIHLRISSFYSIWIL